MERLDLKPLQMDRSKVSRLGASGSTSTATSRLRKVPMSADDDSSSEDGEKKEYSFLIRFAVFAFIAGPASVFGFGMRLSFASSSSQYSMSKASCSGRPI